MVKIHTTLSIEEEVIKKAKERNVKLSDVAEQALRKYTDITEEECFNKKTTPTCDFCGIQERWATKEEPIGMTWLCPDEMWICSKCLNNKIRLSIHTLK